MGRRALLAPLPFAPRERVDLDERGRLPLGEAAFLAEFFQARIHALTIRHRYPSADAVPMLLSVWREADLGRWLRRRNLRIVLSRQSEGSD